jgi:hypothetical protein
MISLAGLVADAAAQCGDGQAAVITVDMTSGPAIEVTDDATARQLAGQITANLAESPVRDGVTLFVGVTTAAAGLTPYFPCPS